MPAAWKRSLRSSTWRASQTGGPRPIRAANAGDWTWPWGLCTNPRSFFSTSRAPGLDPQNRANLWEYVRQSAGRGTTIFVTTHYLEEADTLCDRVMIVDHGQVVAEGAPRDLKRESRATA